MYNDRTVDVYFFFHFVFSFQLLQEVCSLGRDPKYIGFKMGAKLDGSDTDNSSTLGQGTGRVAVVNEEPMSDEEEDDDDRFSFTSTTTAAKVVTENDKIKDNSKYDIAILCFSSLNALHLNDKINSIQRNKFSFAMSERLREDSEFP